MFDRIKRLFSVSNRDEEMKNQLEALRQRLPVPVFWLFGKTQSGKTSVIKFLTGAEKAEIGKGFQPCTRFSQEYDFPTAETPLLSFLDTRGLDEPGYDASEDLVRFDPRAHVIMVTVRVTDHAQENVLRNLKKLRQAQPRRPIVLVLTCLHEAYPHQQHPQPYPFTSEGQYGTPPGAGGQDGTPPGARGDPLPTEPTLPEDLLRNIAEQKRRFEGLVDRAVMVDLTPPEEGFNDPDYGGERLRQVLVELLPGALGQALVSLDRATGELQDLYSRRAEPYILGYSGLAATAGALPLPVVDVVLVPAIQTRMVYHLARLAGQPMTGQRFAEMASALGLGVLTRQFVKQLLRSAFKLVPFVGQTVGAVAGGAMGWAATFALGRAFCYYYRAVHQGHIPRPEDLKHYYQEQLAEAEKIWRERFGAAKDKGK